MLGEGVIVTEASPALRSAMEDAALDLQPDTVEEGPTPFHNMVRTRVPVTPYLVLGTF